MAHPDSAPGLLAGLNAALFVVGALLGDVLLLGRLIVDVRAFSASAERTGLSSFSPYHLEGVETAFLLGFVVSLVAMLCAGFLWLSTGHPANRREASWTLTGACLMLLLLVGLILMFLLSSVGARIGVLMVVFVISSALLMYLVGAFIRAALEKQGSREGM